jgi:hypothetical protein
LLSITDLSTTMGEALDGAMHESETRSYEMPHRTDWKTRLLRQRATQLPQDGFVAAASNLNSATSPCLR